MIQQVAKIGQTDILDKKTDISFVYHTNNNEEECTLSFDIKGLFEFMCQ